MPLRKMDIVYTNFMRKNETHGFCISLHSHGTTMWKTSFHIADRRPHPADDCGLQPPQLVWLRWIRSSDFFIQFGNFTTEPHELGK